MATGKYYVNESGYKHPDLLVIPKHKNIGCQQKPFLCQDERYNIIGDVKRKLGASY